MASGYHERFKQLIEEIRPNINTISSKQLFNDLEGDENTVVVDVRERDEWQMSHIPGALCVPKSIIERDIEFHVPNPSRKVALYSRGGFLCMIAADSLQKMGYEHVYTLKGGYHAWTIGGYPIKQNGDITYPDEEQIQELLKENKAADR